MSATPALQLRRWIAAARPKTLPLTVTPVAVGIGLAVAETGTLALGVGLMTLIAAVAIQIGTNLHNDAADFQRGTDTAARLGPPRASAQGWFSVTAVQRAAHLAFGLALLLGLLLLARGGWPILLLGLASLAAGYAYTGGPRPIAHGPLGELFVLAFFGCAAVAGSYYLQTLALSPAALLAGLGLGLPAAAVLLVNNYRDLDTDRAAGRRTLCHYLGRSRARRIYALCLLAPLPLLAPLGASGLNYWLLAALPAALLLIRALAQVATADGLRLNRLLARTGQFQALLGLLLLLGLAI